MKIPNSIYIYRSIYTYECIEQGVHIYVYVYIYVVMFSL